MVDRRRRRNSRGSGSTKGSTGDAALLSDNSTADRSQCAHDRKRVGRRYDCRENDFDTEIELLKSSSLADRVASSAHLDRGAIGGVTVKVVPNTKLVDISVTDSDPARAQKVANAYGAAYSAANLDKRFQANAYAKSFLEDQLKQLKLRLEQSEKPVAGLCGKTANRRDRR